MELEQRLQIFESELSLMKGEVRQILVDLREIVMDERRPFQGVSSPTLSARNGNARSVAGARVVRAEAGPDYDHEATVIALDASIMDVQINKAQADSSDAEPLDAPTPSSTAQQAVNPNGYSVEAGCAGLPDLAHQMQEEESATLGALSQVRANGQGRHVGRRSDASDINLLANLIRWAAAVKAQLGAEQLRGLLDLYKLTAHLPEAIEKVIVQVVELEALPKESTEQELSADTLTNYIVELHGIVYGPGYAVTAPQ